MRRSLEIRFAAAHDLEQCARHIRKDSPRSASRFLQAAKTTCRMLLKFPAMGSTFHSIRPELKGLHVFPVKGFRSYLLFYRPTRTGIELIRVLHGARDIPTILGGTTGGNS
jgi:toxin ParE1/3/4